MLHLPTDPARRRALARLGVAILTLAALVAALALTVGVPSTSQRIRHGPALYPRTAVSGRGGGRIGADERGAMGQPYSREDAQRLRKSG